MSRAFGDIEFKTLKEQAWERVFSDDIITAEPEIKRVQLQPATDELMVLASDGLWDAVTSQHAVNFVRRALHRHANIRQAADELVSMALERGSTDNISVIVVCFAGEPHRLHKTNKTTMT